MMKRVLVLGFILFALGACSSDVVIQDAQNLKGKHKVKSWTVSDTGEVTLTGDLEISSDGDIVVDGAISARDRGTYKVKLTSEKGSISIGGSIITPQGLSGDPATGDFNVKGGEAKDGGDIVIYAVAGTVTISGTITAGDGGTGGSATATAAGSLVTATSGGQGDGGNIEVYADGLITISGDITSGSGQLSGAATATNTGADGRAQARAAASGSGGDITVESYSNTITLTTDADIVSGRGGFTGSATATADNANAFIEDAGDAGDIKLTVAAGMTLNVPAGDSKLHVGEGGSTAGSTANGTAYAEASSGAGGLAGSYKDQAKGEPADAGGSGTATANLPPKTPDIDQGIAGTKTKAGGRTTALNRP